MRIKVALFAAVISCLVASVAFAQEKVLGPRELLIRTTHSLVEEFKKADVSMQTEPQKVYDIIETVLIPHIDFGYMSRWVLGRNAWRKATEEQQVDFEEAFKVLLVHTYANVVSEFVDETFEYQPIRGDISEKNRVQVVSVITQAGGDAIHVVYRLLEKKDKSWMVYDIIIEGVSLLKGFQAQFEPTLNTKGLGALIKDMQEHNQQRQAAAISAATPENTDVQG